MDASEFLLQIKEQGSSAAASAVNSVGEALNKTASASSAFDVVASGAKAITPALAGLGDTVVSLATGSIPSAISVMSSLGDTLGGAVTGAAHKASEALAALGPEGEAAGAALEAIAGAASALIGSLTTVMGLIIQITEKSALMSDRFAALAGSAAGGKAVQAMLANLNLPFATSQVNEWAQSLLAAGIKGKQLEADVKAIAAATALMGDAGGAAAQSFFKRLGEGGPAADKLLKDIQQGGRRSDAMLKEMGLSLADIGGKAAVAKMSAEQLHEAIAKALAQRGKGPLEDMALSLTNILTKAQEGIKSLFSKLGPFVKPFMKEVSKLFGEFGKGGSLIKTLTPIVTNVFGTLFSWGTKAVRLLHDVFTWFMNSGKAGGVFSGVVAAAKSTWAVLVNIFHTVQAALSPVISLFKGLLANAMVMKGVRTIFTVLAVVIGAVVATIATLVAAFVVVAAAAAAFVGLIVGAISGVVGEVVSFVESIIGALTSLPDGASSAASGFISGLVGGITSGVGAVVSAVSGLASSALGAFTGALGIHSPSTVLWEHGEENMAGAVAGGVDKGGAKVESSMAKLGDDAGKAAPPARGKQGARSGAFFDIHDNHFGGDMTEDKLHEWMDSWWEKKSLEAPS